MAHIGHALGCSNPRCRGACKRAAEKPVKLLQLRTEPTKEAHCPSCLLTDSHLEKYRATFECSRVECPKRTPAAPLMGWGKP